MTPIRIAVIGLGKIARDQHLPVIAADAAFRLAATVDPATTSGDVPGFASLDALLADGPPVDAVALCTPPQVRHPLALQALRRGLHVLLEKPPAATLAEADQLAAASRTTLFAAWHSRFAAGVAPARAWLANRRVERVAITWREDVRIWHPGQAWIWQPGGMGVFDPGINALSIATHILPAPLTLTAAELEIPGNRAAPIAARLALRTADGVAVEADFDWRQTGEQSWDIAVDTDAGRLLLDRGGARLALPGERLEAGDEEYPALYRHFAGLIRDGASDVDFAPLALIEDAFRTGRRIATATFDD